MHRSFPLVSVNISVYPSEQTTVKVLYPDVLHLLLGPLPSESFTCVQEVGVAVGVSEQDPRCAHASLTFLFHSVGEIQLVPLAFNVPV